ncbi:MAG: DinB family protein [Spirosomataceae bacterium]
MDLTSKEIYDNLERVVNQYIISLDEYSDPQFSTKRDAETWSLGQMYEHLVLTSNFFFMANVMRCLEQRKGQIGGEKNEWGEKQFKYGGFPPRKFKIPEVLQGPEPVAKSRDEYKSLLRKVLEDARKLVEPIAQNNGEYKTLHPPFGFLNANEWFYMMEMHFRHHLRQKEELEMV